MLVDQEFLISASEDTCSHASVLPFTDHFLQFLALFVVFMSHDQTYDNKSF